jgi:hypothetical protein
MITGAVMGGSKVVGEIVCRPVLGMLKLMVSAVVAVALASTMASLS